MAQAGKWAGTGNPPQAPAARGVSRHLTRGTSMSEKSTPTNGSGLEGLLDRHEAAKLLSIGLRTLDRLMADGEIPVVRIGTAARIRPSAIERFCEARESRLDSKRRAAIRGKQ